MAYVEGRSLVAKLRDEGPMQPKDAAKLVRKITDAVHYAHLKGVVHRGLKPGNVLFDTNGEPRVTGFGLAKQVDTEASNSATRAAAMIRLARAEVFLIRRSSPLLTSSIGRSPV